MFAPLVQGTPNHGVHAYPRPRSKGWAFLTSKTQYISLAPLQKQATRNKAGTFWEYCGSKHCMNHVRQRLLPKRRACPPGAGSPPLELSLSSRRQVLHASGGEAAGERPGRERLCFSCDRWKSHAVSPGLHPFSISNLSCSLASKQLCRSWHRGLLLSQPTNLLCSSEVSLPECQ